MTVDQAEHTAPLISPGVLHTAAFEPHEGPFKQRLEADAKARFTRRFDERARALFLPGEQIVLAFPGVSRLPKSRTLGAALIGYGLSRCIAAGVELSLLDDQHLVGVIDLAAALIAVSTGIALLVVCRRSGSFGVLVAMTTQGVVECRTDWRGRPRSIVQRGPAAQLTLSGKGRLYRRVSVGDVIVYAHYRTEAMLRRTVKPVSRRTAPRTAPGRP